MRIYHYVPATGTQLQHALGNLFKNEHLNRLFDYFNLQRCIRHSPAFEAEKHRHIFVYGMLGFLLEHSDKERLRAFIIRHFVLPYQQILMPQTRSHNIEGQCNLLSRMLYNCNVHLSTEKEAGIFRAIVTAGDHILAQESSKSYRYVHRKAMKKALSALAESVEEHEKAQPGYEARRQKLETVLQQKQEAEKAQKQQAYHEKQAKKKAEKDQRKQARQEAAIIDDIKRRKAKSAAKARKDEQARRAAANASKMENMSANKRRHLQDKGQL